MYNRDKDFANLLDQIDAHCFTGDTLHDEENREIFSRYLGRFERSLKSHIEIAPEIAEAERLERLEQETEERSEAQRKLNERIQGQSIKAYQTLI